MSCNPRMHTCSRTRVQFASFLFPSFLSPPPLPFPGGLEASTPKSRAREGPFFAPPPPLSDRHVISNQDSFLFCAQGRIRRMRDGGAEKMRMSLVPRLKQALGRQSPDHLPPRGTLFLAPPPKGRKSRAPVVPGKSFSSSSFPDGMSQIK